MPEVPCVSRYFVAYLTSSVAVAAFFLSRSTRKDPCVASRTNRFFSKALDTLADVDDKNLNAYQLCKVTAWYRRFPPVHSPDRMDDTHKVKDDEEP